MLTIYGLKQCTTTQKAKKFLEGKGIEFHEIIDIRETPPSKEILSSAIQQTNHQARKIMNTSGGLYREMGLKDKLDIMTEEDIVDLMANNGMLIKRPFITDGLQVTAGAKEEELERVWL